MKIMLTVAFGIALGMLGLSAHALAASTSSAPVADVSATYVASGLSVRVVETAGPDLTSGSRMVSRLMANPAVQLAPRKLSVSRAPSPTAVVATDNPFRAEDEVLDFRDGSRPLIRKAGSAGIPTFSCGDAPEMLTHGLARGSIPAARITFAASLVTWCSEQHEARLGAGKDVAATAEPTSLVADLVDDSTTVEEQPKLTPRHVGQCGLSEL